MEQCRRLSVHWGPQVRITRGARPTRSTWNSILWRGAAWGCGAREMTAIPPPPPDLGRRAAWLARAIRASPHNLVSPRAKAELETRHIPECLALAEFLPPGPASLVDIGSGAGLPGVLVALRRPDLTVTLIEATSKKARFLQRAGLALSLIHI